ncbi:MAG TPA: HAD family hydrolase [Solirubrobacterales bacterium]|nr:HAD family hydrolase [Solirubrobacterales bacterium]
MTQPVKAITFDFWNTIARERPGAAIVEARREAVAAACEAGDVAVEAGQLVTTLEEVAATYQRSWSEGTHFHPSEGAEMLVRTLGIEGAAREMVAEAFLSAGRDAKLELAPDICPCLEALGERGLGLGIVCDVGFTGGKLLRDFLDREGLLGHFSAWAFSDEVGHYKPSPQIFEAALDALDAEPSEAAHIGDLRRTDIAGAAAIGMKTIRYRGLHDDRGADGEEEADFVLDSHRELPGLIDRIGQLED